MKGRFLPGSRFIRFNSLIPAGMVLAASSVMHVFASGVVNPCTETALRSVVAGGGTVTFGCDGVIRLTETLHITTPTRIDATGYDITLSGNNAVRLIIIEPLARLELHRLTLADGLAQGTAGATGQDGQPGEGGALLNVGGVLEATDCRFINNRARGGDGGNPGPNFGLGLGGSGKGGAIFNRSGDIYLTNCWLLGNRAEGGNGGPSPSRMTYGAEAYGGAIQNDYGIVYLVHTLVSNNLALSGRDQRFSVLAASAPAYGGSIYNAGTLNLIASQIAANECRAVSLASAAGGALYQPQGVTRIEQTVFMDNKAEGGVGGKAPPHIGPLPPMGGLPAGPATGGAIHLRGGELHCLDSTLAANAALGGKGPEGEGGGAQGGAIYNEATTTLTNCTFSVNFARGGPSEFGIPGNAEGGAIYNTVSGSLQVSHGTIASNSATRGSYPPTPNKFQRGGAVASLGTVRLQNTILAHSLSGSNWFSASLIDDGNNLSSDLSCPLNYPGSLCGVDPLLGPLWDYGGPTPTMALRAGSPAIDGAPASTASIADQRGRTRPSGPAGDIGAFESSSPYTVLGQITGYLPPAPNFISLASDPGAAIPDSLGRYFVSNFTAGEHLLSPLSPETVCVPSNRLVHVTADVADVDFHSYRSNALVIEKISGQLRGVFAGEAHRTYHVLTSTDLSTWTPWSTNTTESSGLFEFMNPTAPPSSGQFFQAVRP